MDSDLLARVMNAYFENAVTHCIHETDGTVVKFIGDAIFAIWNAPEKQANHQELAVRGALLLRDQVTRSADGPAGVKLHTRIGLHCGVANVGNFGSSTRIDYTAIGENINLASRMEGLYKYLGTTLLATGDIYRGASNKFVARLAGHFRLKGFEKVVEVYELLAPGDQAEASRLWREAFQAALEQFQKRRFSQADAAFQQVLQLRPDDGPAQFYLRQIGELRATPPADDWSGEIELKEK
jgi:adenylate cyclase